MPDPILYHVCLPGNNLMVIHGGLHQIGQQPPYFSITADIYDGPRAIERRMVSCGCQHDEILKARPDLADLVALHLSDIDGLPMHAEANGYYWLAGYLGGLGERYHGASGSDGRTPAECFTIFAEHMRFTPEEALFHANLVRNAHYPKDVFSVIVERQLPRWKAEADAAIAKYDLQIYT